MYSRNVTYLYFYNLSFRKTNIYCSKHSIKHNFFTNIHIFNQEGTDWSLLTSQGCFFFFFSVSLTSRSVGPPAAGYFELKTESQSRGSDPAADSAVFGMEGKKDCILCLNSDSWKKQRRNTMKKLQMGRKKTW